MLQIAGILKKLTKMMKTRMPAINKASETFRGLSDAAENSADRATKTPHVGGLSVADNSKMSSKRGDKI